MIVVTDTSPLIHLATIGRLELLRSLYQEVFVPAAVFDEAIREAAQYPDGNQIRGQTWLRVRAEAQRALGRSSTSLDCCTWS